MQGDVSVLKDRECQGGEDEGGDSSDENGTGLRRWV